MSLIPSLILAGTIILIIAVILIVVAKQYRKVGPNEVLIIAGGRKRTIIGPDGSKIKVGYRYRLGGGTFVIPFIETVYRLPMDVITLNIKTPEVLTNSSVPIMAEASAQVKVDSSDSAIRLAAEQFL
ncbi:MAG: SPFH domain-containing protein, partial [Candidatus Aminicenantes bacterium]|nr:SPFH domain-containing protein [Candidatus Aminicenantes bacterium]